MPYPSRTRTKQIRVCARFATLLERRAARRGITVTDLTRHMARVITARARRARARTMSPTPEEPTP